MVQSYADFLESKRIIVSPTGIEVSKDEINPKLFEFQRDITLWALRKGKAAVFAGTGLGKTLVQLEWSRHICEHTNGNILILAPLAVSHQTVREGQKLGIEVHHCRNHLNVKPGINITNYERLHLFDPASFVGVVLDECFAPDTLVDIVVNSKDLQRKPISNIVVGDAIINAGGIDYVVETHKRRINRAVYIEANGGITCSENHPFFTLYGWRSAKDLRPGDYIMATETAMRLVRGDILSEINIPEISKILRDILLSEMENEAEGYFGEDSFARSSCKERQEEERVVQSWLREGLERIRKDSPIEPYEKRKNTEKSFADITGYESQTFRAWWKRNRNDNLPEIFAECTVRQMDSGICYITGETKTGIPDALQGRFGKSRIEDCNRDRWKQSLLTQESGQEERQYVGFVRVESVEILELSSPRLDKYRDKDGNVYFYDIKATRHPSYSVNGLLVHNSSILKSFDGHTRKAIIEAFGNTPYRLACTATPAPNDYMELGNHAEFLGVMTYNEMLSMFFVHDGDRTSNWRLKGHAQEKFWEWVASWAVMLEKPSDLGYEDNGFILPPLNIEQVTVKVDKPPEGSLFVVEARTLQEQRKAKKSSLADRVKACAEITNSLNEPCIIWSYLNDESEMLANAIEVAVEVRGSHSPEYKEKAMMDFTEGKTNKLVTKPSIAGWGMNWQHCSKMIFCGLDHSFESWFQAIRRCWRFGQIKPVDVYVVVAETEGAIAENIKRKEREFKKMLQGMVSATQEITKANIRGTTREVFDYATDVAEGDGWKIYLGDCVEVIRNISDDSIHYSIFSPPFASLYVYSQSERDMGNCRSEEEFLTHFRFLVNELYRVLMPGRLLSFHCMNLPIMKQKHGYIGIYDFRGDLIRLFQDTGFIYHSEVVIWKDPVTEMQRTKALGLLHKQLKKDSAMCRQGIPDYLVTMRKPGENPEHISHTDEGFPVALWQRYASPVWMDIKQTNTLQAKSAREHKDEKHIAPLQLEVIERALEIWTNPGDIVLDPFDGIGSTGYVAIKMGRRHIGIELKRSYWEQAVRNLRRAENEAKQPTLFDDILGDAADG
jgi:DNA modification methylase/intein/homing endonuclease